MRFSETIKNVDPGLTISRRHEEWLALSDHPVYSATALAFGLEQLGKPDRVRKGTVSASSLGECLRYQQFVYLGMPKLMPDAKNAMKMANGAFMHLRWQMAGLSEGWLTQAEVPLGENPYRLSGTMDGLLDNGLVLELKSINANGFSRVQTFGPLIPHLFQMATYLLVSERSGGVFVYECKDNQEYKEIPVSLDQLPMQAAEERAFELWQAIESEHLYEPLGKCLDQEGWVYRSCPFRDRCLKVRDWEEV